MKHLNPHIGTREVQDYIQQNLNTEPAIVAMKKSPFAGVSAMELASQVDGKRRSEKKLPLWFQTAGIYFPPKLNLEQASSELTAIYKSDLVRGGFLADLTGGFGIDSFYFSRRSTRVLHIERDMALSEIAQHNAGILGARNIEFIATDSIEYLENTENTFDTLYIDPARRVNSKKVFLLKDTEPDVVSNLDLLLRKAGRVIIKTSPLFDIQSGIKELRHVSQVHVLSAKNDCKEVLWIIDKEFSGETEIVCAALNNVETSLFHFSLLSERQAPVPDFSPPLSYVYEPDVALLKAGCFKSISNTYSLAKLHANTHLYTSENVLSHFIGRIFKVTRTLPYKVFIGARESIKANIITRNFPLSPEALKKKHKLKDGGDSYLLFTTGPNNELIVIQAERIK